MKPSISKKFFDILFSYWATLVFFALLGTGAAVATFMENDYGTSTARVFVYNHIWYEAVLVLTTLNLIGIMYRRKMYKQLNGRFIFHLSFVVMLIGAGLTRYAGYEGIMNIKEGETTNAMVSLEPYMQATIIKDGKTYNAEFQKEFAAIGDNSFHYIIPFENTQLELKLAKFTFAKKQKATMNLIETDVLLGDEKQTVKLVGKRGNVGIVRTLNFKDNTIVHLTYGSKPLSIPFSIKLRDFQLDRYPGSMAPSSYASEVTVIDMANNEEFDYRIFMNSTLIYGGFQFFQSSYDPDEKGTVLSVNNDPGTIPTYLGYFLLALGLLMNMFDKKSRFAKLTKYIKQFNAAIVAVIFTAVLTVPSIAEEKIDNAKYLENFKANSKDVAKVFGEIVVQANMGRMKPMNSLNMQIVQKLTKKSSFLGMNPDQIVLGMLTAPDIWSDVKMISIKTPKLKKILGVPESRKYIAFSEVFTKDGYVLTEYSKNANAIDAKLRGTFERDVIKIDERLSIAFQVFNGDLFKLFPKPKHASSEDLNNKWFTPMEAMQQFPEEDAKIVQTMTRGFITHILNENYTDAIKYAGLIKQFQQKIGSDVMPSQSVLDMELLFNELDIFPKITLAYVLLGLVLFIVAFFTVFNEKLASRKLNLTIFSILAILFAIQTAGMAMRWYISGHAPWSDTYESLIYIGWSAMFAGLFFFRKSTLALSATVVMAGIFMFTAHLSHIDPQITNLVPVLKSYWLTIHVSIITGSYGFLAIGCMLGFMALLLFIFRSESRPNVDKSIYHITAINEAALIIGLAMLIVGNFLGGVWANESWGRYWGWDPKETWAYVAIVTYAFVLHMRFIPKLNTPFAFATASTLAFATILMTYFGVNFYLSGMHSYATGDPVPIPTWVYVVTAIVFIVIALATRGRKLEKLKF
jgi:cytochrome c-type biogenesis protein CcsB